MTVAGVGACQMLKHTSWHLESVQEELADTITATTVIILRSTYGAPPFGAGGWRWT